MKLFEFEQLEEGVAAVMNIGNVCVVINQHMRDRAAQRGIPNQAINALLKKIPLNKKKFIDFSENQKFYFWSNFLGCGIGLRKRDDKDGYPRVEVMTAIVREFDGPDPVFIVG